MFNSIRKLDPWKVFGLLIVTVSSLTWLGIVVTLLWVIFLMPL